MDEKSYLDEYRRTLRNWNQRKPVSRVCVVSPIKPEYQSSVMAVGNKSQLWDPTGRIYILMRVDKVLATFNATVEVMGRAKGEAAMTGVVLIYPSMVFCALEVVTDSVLALNTLLAESMGSEESYVQRPTLINEAHGVQRMYSKMTSVILNIPGPMKMDLDRMRAEWLTSFREVMKKVYALGRALSSPAMSSKLQDDLQRPPAPDLLLPNPASLSNKESQASTYGSDSSVNAAGELNAHYFPGEDSISRLKSSTTTLAATWQDHTGDNDEATKKREQFIARRIANDCSGIDRKMARKSRDLCTNAAGEERRTLQKPLPTWRNSNKSLEPGELTFPPISLVSRARQASSCHMGNETEPYSQRAKRMWLAYGDPALQYIPPQRDLVLILNCDKFKLLSESVGLHSKKLNYSTEDGRGWPHDTDAVRLPLDVIMGDSVLRSFE